MPKGKINIYDCTCGNSIVTKDIEEGVTPFFIACRVDGCENLATSNFYHVDQTLVPSYFWRKPTEVEKKHLTVEELDHCDMGGLLLYKTKKGVL